MINANDNAKVDARDRPKCVDCAYVLPLAFRKEEGRWVRYVAPYLLHDDRPFGYAAGMLESDPPHELRCKAPQLAALLCDEASTVGLCNAVRDFSHACGVEGKWFARAIKSLAPMAAYTEATLDS